MRAGSLKISKGFPSIAPGSLTKEARRWGEVGANSSHFSWLWCISAADGTVPRVWRRCDGALLLELLLLRPAPALAPWAARGAETGVETFLSCWLRVSIRGAVTSLPVICIGTGLVHSVMAASVSMGCALHCCVRVGEKGDASGWIGLGWCMDIPGGHIKLSREFGA